MGVAAEQWVIEVPLLLSDVYQNLAAERPVVMMPEDWTLPPYWFSLYPVA